ncbi:MAG: hypothetical protein IPM18_11985 [Phycisphaerales bacterium]|nr:hypothetical protein [Phycisphaerales bacterium]
MPSNIIRREAGPRPTVFRFPDVEAEAARILARAQREAEGLRAATEKHLAAERESQRRNGYEEGFRAGQAAGRAAALEEGRQAARTAAAADLQQLTAALGGALQDYEQRRHTLLAEAETGLLAVAVAIAERVCKTAALHSGTVARANVRALLELVRHQHDLEFHLHPEEAALLRDELPQLAQQIAGADHVRIVPDTAIGRGGCVLHSRAGAVDATLETQLRQVAESLVTDGQETLATGSVADRGESSA